MKARRLQCFCMTQAKTPEMSLARPRCSARFPNLLYRGFLTRRRFAASKASELATVLPIGNRRYGRFGNLRYVQRALNRYAAPPCAAAAAHPPEIRTLPRETIVQFLLGVTAGRWFNPSMTNSEIPSSAAPDIYRVQTKAPG